MNFGLAKIKKENKMQISTINQATLSPQVQSILPILDNLKADDFDDYLGDDFWFPEDDILYK